jgi:hypothetical protein
LGAGFNAIGLKQPNVNLQVVQLTDAYEFYNKTTSVFEAKATGYSISGIPLGSTYSNTDKIYQFPLNYNDVDWVTSTAIIRETKNGTPRRIGLAPRVIEILKSLPRSISGNFFNVKNISSFEKSFRLAVKKAGLKDFRFHDLRHCGATHLIESGWSTMELMQQGGWNSQQMAKRYSNISPVHLANKMKKINFI